MKKNDHEAADVQPTLDAIRNWVDTSEKAPLTDSTPPATKPVAQAEEPPTQKQSDKLSFYGSVPKYQRAVPVPYTPPVRTQPTSDLPSREYRDQIDARANQVETRTLELKLQIARVEAEAERERTKQTQLLLQAKQISTRTPATKAVKFNSEMKRNIAAALTAIGHNATYIQVANWIMENRPHMELDGAYRMAANKAGVRDLVGLIQVNESINKRFQNDVNKVRTQLREAK